MRHNYSVYVSPAEKLISVLSYLTMGIIGLIWIMIAYYVKKRLKFFLMYNITQSMIISVILAIINLCLQILFAILAKIPFVDFIVAGLNLIMTYKVIAVYMPFSGMISFSVFQLFVFLLILYIIFGICFGRIFYIPFLSKLMNKIMKNY